MPDVLLTYAISITEDGEKNIYGTDKADNEDGFLSETSPDLSRFCASWKVAAGLFFFLVCCKAVCSKKVLLS